MADLFNTLEAKKTETNLEIKQVEEQLQKIACIFKALISMAEPNITDTILSDKFFKSTFGALENLPELQGKLLCREFFEKVQYKEIVPINNEHIVKKIHICYRINYLRETIFAKEEGPVV